MLEKTLTQVRLSQGVDGRTEGQGFRGAAWGRPRQQGLRVSEHIPITGWDQRRRDRVSSGGGRESGVRGRRGAHSPGAGAARAAEDTKTQGPPGVPQEPCRDTGTPGPPQERCPGYRDPPGLCRSAVQDTGSPRPLQERCRDTGTPRPPQEPCQDTGTPGPPQGRRQDAGTPRPQQERCPAHTLTLAMTLTPDLWPLNCQRINTLSEDPVCQNPLWWQQGADSTHTWVHTLLHGRRSAPTQTGHPRRHPDPESAGPAAVPAAPWPSTPPCPRRGGAHRLEF